MTISLDEFWRGASVTALADDANARAKAATINRVIVSAYSKTIGDGTSRLKND
jgi:hypothetical protein